MICSVYSLKELKRVYGYKGFSVEKMALFCGVSRQQIYNVFNEKTIPNVYLAMKICDYIEQFDNYTIYVNDVFLED